jgi:hypothetical protein
VISLSDTQQLNFKSIKLFVPPYFYVFDGSGSRLLAKHRTESAVMSNKKSAFYDFEPIDSTTVAFRGIDTRSKKMFCIVSAHQGSTLQLSDKLLQKQIGWGV